MGNIIEYMSSFLGINHENAHRAWNDAEVSAEFFVKI